MILLLDQGLPRSVVVHLATTAIAAVHVGDLSLSSAEDAAILQEARRLQAVVVTMDADFHALLAMQGAASPSVIRLRIEGLKGEAIAKLLLDVVDLARLELAQGAVVSVTQHRIRVRLLPIG